MDKERSDDLKMFLRMIAIVVVLILSGCSPSGQPAGQQDLFSSQVSNQATGDALLQQAQLQAQFLTATAQAPIINITSTAAAFAMEQSYAQATSTAAAQTQMAAMTVTAQSWTPTPNATMTAMSAQQYWTATAVSLQAERDKKTNDLKAFLLYVAGTAALIIAIFAGYVLVKRLTHMPPEVDLSGRTRQVINVLSGTVVDPERMPNYRGSLSDNLLQELLYQWLRKKLDLQPELPLITAERQDTVIARSQMIDMATRAKLPRRLIDEQSKHLLPEFAESVSTHFTLPSWDLINSWDGKNGIPYYTARGLETIDIERHPHLAVIGATGEGKSRRFLRPMIACALAAGHRVVIIGKSADYWPFEGHPNATLVTVNKLTEPGQAQRYASILEALVIEMNRRDDVLTSIHQSTWTHAGRNRTFIVLDELGNALRFMQRATSNQSQMWIEGLVSEGRKVGFNMVVANQRLTGMPAILSQTGKAVFRVEADEEKAHRALSGASSLNDGYFLAKFGIPKIAGAFEPTDEEIRQFLASRPVTKVESDDDWIDAVATDAPSKLTDQSQATEDPPPGETLGQFVFSLDRKDQDAIQLYQAGGMSNSHIAELAYGSSNGRTVRRVNELIERYKAFIATTTTQNVPDFGAVAASSS